MHMVTARLRLDALQLRDAEMLFQYRTDPDVCRYQGWRPTSVIEARGFIERNLSVMPDTTGSWWQRAIRLADTGELIGDIGMHFMAEAQATVELGISLSPRHQRRGYATEAMSAVIGFVFDDLRKHRVCGSVDPRNEASITLLERVGMRREAYFRESIRVDGEWVDDMIYAMLDREWSARRATAPHRG
jgi:RimJ/RimL family protein N-acetyltransferase